MNLGIIQSRLSPVDFTKGYQYWPETWWDNEFRLAKLYGFNHIELIYDDNPNNLLNTDEGVVRIFKESNKNVVGIQAICADYFIKKPFWSEPTQSIKTLNKLMINGYRLGARNITIPLIEESSLYRQPDREKKFIENLKPCLDIAGRYMMNICLETDLPPVYLKSLVQSFGSDRIGICHDTGNCMELDCDPNAIFSIYFPFVKHIHLKDKIRFEKENVEIGTGGVRFTYLFDFMRTCGYDGTITLQCARKEYDLDFIKKQFYRIKNYAIPTNKA